MKNTILACGIATMLSMSAANAGNIDIGLDGGVIQPSNLQGGIFTENTQRQAGGRLFAEYNENHLGVGVAYNMFGDIKFDVNPDAKDPKKKFTAKANIQGPEVYGKVHARFGDFEPYGKIGVMYSMTDGSSIKDSNDLAPTAGFGANYYLGDHVGLRAGYDRYWKIVDNDDGLKTDLDFFHAGAFVRF